MLWIWDKTSLYTFSFIYTLCRIYYNIAFCKHLAQPFSPIVLLENHRSGTNQSRPLWKAKPGFSVHNTWLQSDGVQWPFTIAAQLHNLKKVKSRSSSPCRAWDRRSPSCSSWRLRAGCRHHRTPAPRCRGSSRYWRERNTHNPGEIMEACPLEEDTRNMVPQRSLVFLFSGRGQRNTPSQKVLGTPRSPVYLCMHPWAR